MNKHIEFLKQMIRMDLKDAAERSDSGKPLTKAMQKEIFHYVLGFGRALESVGLAMPDIITLNLSCGRADRFILKEDL